MKSRVLSFGSLASPLARSQTQTVIDRIQEKLPRLTCQLNVLASPVAEGHRESEPFSAVSRQEWEFLAAQLRDEQSRLIVVEAPDLPYPLPEDLAVVCVPDRSNPFDAFLNRQGLIMDEMTDGSSVGVLSLRSKAQMSALWPDISFQVLRGGIDRAMETHLRKSEIDGLVLPAAVTEHLGIQGIVAEIFSPEFILPGAGQGILVVVGLAGDLEVGELLSDLHSKPSSVELQAELAFRSRIVSDQDLPVGALARVRDGELVILGATGSGVNRISVNGPVTEAEAIGAGLAQQILSSGKSFIDLLEADFPEGIPDDEEDDELLDSGDDLDDLDDPDDLDDLEDLRR